MSPKTTEKATKKLQPNVTRSQITAANKKRKSVLVDDEIADSQPSKMHKVETGPSTKPAGQDQSTTSLGFTVEEEIGDLFGLAPKNAVLIHACNCQGSWGGGIALAFRGKYPKAFKEYKSYCDSHVKSKTTKQLVGTPQLIAPLDEPGHFIGCLFTSDRHGRAKDSPSQILDATKSSMEDLIKQINDWNRQHKEDEKITGLYMCKINSGLFNVPWEKTKAILEELKIDLVDLKKQIMVRDRS